MLFPAEAHPDAIGADGVASEDAYRKDLEYLKKKVSSLTLTCDTSLLNLNLEF